MSHSKLEKGKKIKSNHQKPPQDEKDLKIEKELKSLIEKNALQTSAFKKIIATLSKEIKKQDTDLNEQS